MKRLLVAMMILIASLEVSNAGEALDALPKNREFLRAETVDIQPIEARTVGASAKSRVTASVRVFDRNLTLGLYPANILTPDCEVEDAIGEKVERRACADIYYYGTVSGESKSSVRASIENGVLNARIVTSHGTYRIEPLGRFERVTDPHDLVVYREEDLAPPADDSESCGASSIDHVTDASDVETIEGNFAYDGLVDKFAAIGIILIGDNGYLAPPTSSSSCANNSCGGGSESEMVSTIADNALIYMNRFNVSLKVAGIKLGTSGTGISETVTNVNTLLSQVNGYFDDQMTLIKNHAQLFTTRNLTANDGSSGVRGAAAIGTIATTTSTSVIERHPQGTLTRRASAHEFAHTLNACEVSTTNQPAACTSLPSGCANPNAADTGTLMTASLTGITKDYYDKNCNMSRVFNRIQARLDSGALFFHLGCGDADGNGSNPPTATDTLAALQMANGVFLPNPLADVNASGVVTATDANTINNVVVGFIPAEDLYPCGSPGVSSF